MTQIRSSTLSEILPEQRQFSEISDGAIALAAGAPSKAHAPRLVRAPSYLVTNYWWAYVHPKAVQFFERQWLVNLILWGNYPRLARAAVAELGESPDGKTLQVACAYGNMTNALCERVEAAGGSLDVIDVLPIQLKNLHDKLPAESCARLLVMDSASMNLPDASYDRALVFFLLHEQPEDYRRRTLHEVFRVVKPGGKIVIVDYALPRWWNPLRYLWRPLLALLEPFALDLWRSEVSRWMPEGAAAGAAKTSYFGGLYQKIVIRR